MRTAVCGIAVLTCGFAARAEDPAWEALRGRPILDVRVESSDVFDPARPGEDHFLLAWANALHMVSQPHIVRREFGQEIGDAFDPRLAAECERNLRERGIFQDVAVVVEPLDDGVEVVMRTIDRWSLHTYPVIRSQGGVNQVGLVLGESNLLGLGIEIGASGIYSNDVSEVAFGWRDRRVFGTRWDVGFGLSKDDLGAAQWVGLGHPFYSDDVRWSTEARASLGDTERRIFESGEEVTRFALQEQLYGGYVGLHRQGDRMQRLALFHERRHQTGDVESEIAAVGVAVALLDRDFVVARGIDELGPREELSTGWTLQLGAGVDVPALGAARDRFLYRAEGAWSTPLGADALWGVQLQHYGFTDGGRVEDSRLMVETFGFWRPMASPRTLAWRLGGDALFNVPPDQRFNLGSDDRLRGYEARTLNGTRTLFGSIEQRFATDFRFYFLRFGAVAFVDGAMAWDDGETLDRSHGRLGGGIGLRLGTDPAGHSVTRIDFGFGTDSFAISFASGSYFDVTRVLTFPSTHLW